MAADYGFFPSVERGRLPKLGEVANPECDLLCQPHRLPVAQSADQFSATANRTLLLLELEEGRLVGTNKSKAGAESVEEG